MNFNELNIIISEKPEGCFLKCWIQPRSSRNTIAGIHGNALKINLTAPPVDGKANKELVRFIAKNFDLPKSSIAITSGESSRNKTVFVAGIDKNRMVNIIQQCNNG